MATAQFDQHLTAPWRPTLGAWVLPGGVQFRVWAPPAKRMEVVLEGPGLKVLDMIRQPDGYFELLAPGLQAETLYRFRIDGADAYPDPASRYQPQGVHGPSQVIDASGFRWTDGDWKGMAFRRHVFYELHVGTFSPEGTFGGCSARLTQLKELGVTAIELMPLADFPGQRNWGYDGVQLFAPAHVYGVPDDLRRLVNEAHRLGIAVFLDVVYNHLGPDGNYLAKFNPSYFTTRHQTPWGAAVNFDGADAGPVRSYFIENALYWVHEFHIDGLRLDATHAIVDDSPKHILQELGERLRDSAAPRAVHVVAEDHRNIISMVRPVEEGGWGLQGVWSDDFHHALRRMLAGDQESYYADFAGKLAEVADCIRQGWHFTGQFSTHLGHDRGTPTGESPYDRFIFFLQNHDQVGNRAFGERLHHQISASAYRAASSLLLCCPETPLLFMGQEWGASSPFLFFTDHEGALGKKVREGRRQEFQKFVAFSDPAQRAHIPDPQALETFEASRLNWSEREMPLHAGIQRLYQRLLALRATHPAFTSDRREDLDLHISGRTLILGRRGGGRRVVLVMCLEGNDRVVMNAVPLAPWLRELPRSILFSSENGAYAPKTQPPVVETTPQGLVVTFTEAAAILFGDVDGD